MKITKSKLKQIIKEELEAVMESSLFGPMKASPDQSRRSSGRTSRRDQEKFDSEKNDFAAAAYDNSLNTVGISSSEADVEGGYGIDAIRKRRAQERAYQDALSVINSPLSRDQQKVHNLVNKEFNKYAGWSLKANNDTGKINFVIQPDWVYDAVERLLWPLKNSGQISEKDRIDFMDSMRADRNFASGLY